MDLGEHCEINFKWKYLFRNRKVCTPLSMVYTVMMMVLMMKMMMMVCCYFVVVFLVASLVDEDNDGLD